MSVGNAQKRTVIARVHLAVRGVHFRLRSNYSEFPNSSTGMEAICHQTVETKGAEVLAVHRIKAEAAKLDAAVANLRELGYGG